MWVQCFSAYVFGDGLRGTSGTPGDAVIPEPYSAGQTGLEGLGWVQYDLAFLRQVTLTGNKRWS